MEATGGTNRVSDTARQRAAPIAVELWERLRRIDRAGAEIVLCRTSPKIETKVARPVGTMASGKKVEHSPDATGAPNATVDKIAGAGAGVGEARGEERGGRVWVATIRWYVPPYQFEMVQHIRPTLAEALTLAVEEAEKRGWARGRQ